MAETDRPAPSDDIAQYIIDGLDRQDADSLREIAAHAEKLAELKEAQAAAEMDEKDVVHEDSKNADDLP